MHPELKWCYDVAQEETDECQIWTGSVDNHGDPRSAYEGKRWRPHILILEMLRGPPTKRYKVRRTCGNKLCCNPAHMWRTCDPPPKVRHAKLTEEQVHQIRRMYEHDPRTGKRPSQRAIAEEIGTTRATVEDIVRGRTWAWLPWRA